MNRNSLKEMAGRIFHSFARVTINKADDDPQWQELSADGFNSDSRSKIEHLQSYAFSSVPLPRDQQQQSTSGNPENGEQPGGKAAEGVAVFMGGQRNHPVVIGVDDRRHRPRSMKDGESAQYDDQGQMMYLARDASYFLSPLKMFLRHVKKEKQPKGKQGKDYKHQGETTKTTAEIEIREKLVNIKMGEGDGKNNPTLRQRVTPGRTEFLHDDDTVVGYYERSSKQWSLMGGGSSAPEVRVNPQRIEFRDAGSLVGYYDRASGRWAFGVGRGGKGGGPAQAAKTNSSGGGGGGGGGGGTVSGGSIGSDTYNLPAIGVSNEVFDVVGKRGVNIIAYGFVDWINETDFSDVATDARLDQLKDVGCRVIRMPYNPTGILKLPDGSPGELEQVANLFKQVDRLVEKDFRIVLCCHVSSYDETGWKHVDILADFPDGPKWKRIEAHWRLMGNELANYDSSRVAYQSWNEIAGAPPNWEAALIRMQANLRTVNATTYQVISGTGWSSIAGLIALNPANFDPRTIFACTPYIPQQFTHQNIVESGFPYSGLSFPPIKMERAGIHAQIDAAVADDLITFDRGETVKGYIDTYMDVPLDETWIAGEFAPLRDWQLLHGVPNTSMLITENGVHRDSPRGGVFAPAGATTISMANYFACHATIYRNYGWGYCIWHYDDDCFRIVNSSSYDLDDALLVSLGMKQINGDVGEAKTLFGQMEVLPSRRNMDIINQRIKFESDAGLLAKTSFLYVLRGEYLQHLRLNWVKPFDDVTRLAAAANVLNTFNADAGKGRTIQFDPAAGLYVTTGYIFGASGLESQDNCSIGIKRSVDDGLFAPIDLHNTYSANSMVMDTHGRNVEGYRGLNTGTPVFSSTAGFKPTAAKYAMGSRLSGTEQRLYDNGSLITVEAAASVAPDTTNPFFIGWDGSVGGQYDEAYVGAGLSDDETKDRYLFSYFYHKLFGT